jgi:hypothetical protein
MPRLRFSWIVVIVVVVIAAFQPLNAGWTRTYGGESFDEGKCVEQTSDGGYIITGYTWSFGAGKSNLWLLKTDSLGDTLWTKTYGKQGCEEGFFIQQTNDDGYIITGFIHNPDSGTYQLWLLKTDENGDTLWTREYGKELSEEGYCVKQTNDEGYIITGYIHNPDSGYQLWLLKTDSLGDTLWTRTYGGMESERGFFLQQTDDNGYVITGYTSSFGVNGSELWLLKTDEQGDTLWTRRYGGRWTNIGRCIQETSDGGYVIAGVTTVDSTGAGDLWVGLWLLKTDTLGDTVWAHIYGGWDFDAEGYYVQETHDGGFIVTGWMRSSQNWDDVWLLKTDVNGDTLWTRSYGGAGSDEGYCVQQTDDGGYIVVGKTESFSVGQQDLWLIKTDANGDTLAVVEEPPVTHQSDWLSVGRQIILQYSDMPQGFHASIFDAAGRKVDELHSDGVSGTITWGESMSPGVYFIRPTDESSGNNTARVVIIH